MQHRAIAFALAAAGTAALASAALAGEPRAVVELFTSQGCSDCPAADKLVTELAKRKDVIALSPSAWPAAPQCGTRVSRVCAAGTATPQFLASSY